MLRTLALHAIAAGLTAAMLAWAAPAIAQTNGLCSSCIAGSHCDDSDQVCRPACEARFFSIDPRRRDCLAECASGHAQCLRTAEAVCRTQKACR